MILNCLKVSMLYRTVWHSSHHRKISHLFRKRDMLNRRLMSRAQLEALAKALVVD